MHIVVLERIIKCIIWFYILFSHLQCQIILLLLFNFCFFFVLIIIILYGTILLICFYFIL